MTPRSFPTAPPASETATLQARVAELEAEIARVQDLGRGHIRRAARLETERDEALAHLRARINEEGTDGRVHAKQIAAARAFLEGFEVPT